MSIYCIAQLSSNIRELIQARTYEPIIEKIMNDSQRIFPSKYERILEQSHGECDFTDIQSKQKYDAKLLFSNEQCQCLAKGAIYLQKWLQSLYSEIHEANQALMYQYEFNTSNTLLYREILLRLMSVEADESAILFIPFPIIPDFSHTVYAQFSTDVISHTYHQILISNNPPKCKKTYLIYPDRFSQQLILRDLDSGAIEHLKNSYIQEYIRFEIAELNEDADIVIFK